MTNKMTLQDLKNLFPEPSPHIKEDRNGKVIRTRATQKNHKHVVNPVWLPGIPSISPAQYRHRHIGKKKVKK